MPANAQARARARLHIRELEEQEATQGPSLAPELSPQLSLYAYTQAAWPLVEPGKPFAANWHIEAICEHLEACITGQIQNLIINIPPRCSKSTVVSIMLPTWVWAWKPAYKWLYASYAEELATRDAVRSRRLILSSWYQRLIRHPETGKPIFRLTDDQNQKHRQQNNWSGHRIATSLSGQGLATGEGGDGCVLDDPTNSVQAASDNLRKQANDWVTETWMSRINDAFTSCRIVVMQRLHHQDVTGYLLEQGGWEHLCLPMEYEGDKRVTVLGWSDPRKEEGELLWPARFDRAFVESLKVKPYLYAGQYQQRPAPKGGGMFRRDWWQYYDYLPTMRRIEQVVDSSFKEGVATDPSVCATWGVDGLGNYFLIDLWTDRVSFPQLLKQLHLLNEKHSRGRLRIPVVIEDKASGQSAIQTLRQTLYTADGKLPALNVIAFPDKNDPRQKMLGNISKVARADMVTATVAAGRCYLPRRAPWLEAFIEQHELFPMGKNDDFVDTTSMCLIRMETLANLPVAGILAHGVVKGWQPS